MPSLYSPHERFYLVLQSCAERARRAALTALQPLGITPSAFELLRIIGAHPGTQPVDLVRKLEISRPAVLELMKKSVEKGLIVRASDAGDARRVRLTLTRRGTTVVRRGQKLLDRTVHTLGLSEMALDRLTSDLLSLLPSLPSSLPAYV